MTLKSSVVIFQTLEHLQPQWPLQPQWKFSLTILVAWSWWPSGLEWWSIMSVLKCASSPVWTRYHHFDHLLPLLCFVVIFSFPFSPTGLVPEVPLLQAFENELGRGWTRLIIAILTIVCLCFSLLELSLPLHRMVSNHFPPSFLVTTFWVSHFSRA